MVPKTTIGIASYNGGERLGWLLKSIAMRTPELATGDVRIVVGPARRRAGAGRIEVQSG